MASPLRLSLPPRGALSPNSDVDPLRYYYAPLVGRLFRARLDAGLALLDGLANARRDAPPDGAPDGRMGRLLEIGYGSGLLLPTLVRAARVVDGIDLDSEPAVVRASLDRLGVAGVGDLVRGDACALPFEGARYDAVVAFSILEHVPAPALRTLLAEVARVLAPGGRFLVGCPAVHRAMSLAFAAIGFRGIDHHHVSSIHDVLQAAAPAFTVERRATMPAGLPLGLAPYNAVLLRKR